MMMMMMIMIMMMCISYIHVLQLTYTKFIEDLSAIRCEKPFQACFVLYNVTQ